MKKFLLEGLLYPFIAILFCLSFGIPFTYTGFQTIHVQGTKTDGLVRMNITRSHYWGLYKGENHMEGVTGAALVTDRIRQDGHRKLVSGVFLLSEADPIRIMAGSSNVNDALKWEMVKSINEFINNPAVTHYAETFRVQNVFGWVGLPFLALGILGLFGWPSTIIKHMRN